MKQESFTASNIYLFFHDYITISVFLTFLRETVSVLIIILYLSTHFVIRKLYELKLRVHTVDSTFAPERQDVTRSAA